MAFDFGARRIGLACGDTVSRTATPLAGIANGHSGPRWDTLDSLMRDWQPGLLVVGLPYNVDGSESAMSGTVRAFAARLTERYALPVSLIDKRRLGKADVDAAAACVILERWFLEST
jgi:putative Holliday junction resolvase